MSEINANIVVAPIDLNVTVSTNQLSFTPEPISLNIYSAGIGLPGGATTQIQYNAGGILGGTSNLTYNGGVTTISNVTISSYANLGAIGNVHITGGAANYALITDGAGNLSWGQVANANTAVYANYANFAGTAYSVAGANVTGTVANANYAAYAGNVTIAGQSNITSLGTLTGLTSTGVINLTSASNVALGSNANVHITGGTNGQYLQTDGAGNIAWVSGGGSGNGVVGGSDTQIQFNDGGSFGGNAGFTFNKTTGNVAIPNNLSVVDTISANNYIGNIANANYANYVGNVITSAQPNITSVGSLANLNVVGTSSIQQAQEKVVITSTGSNGSINYDLLTSAIKLDTTAASGNFTINFRGNSTTTLNSIVNTNSSMTCTYISTQSAPYVLTGTSIDGNSITAQWFGGNAPSTGSISGKDVYTFNIIKTAGNTYVLFASIGNVA